MILPPRDGCAGGAFRSPNLSRIPITDLPPQSQGFLFLLNAERSAHHVVAEVELTHRLVGSAPLCKGELLAADGTPAALDDRAMHFHVDARVGARGRTRRIRARR